MTTTASLFTGGGGFEQGAMMAGFTPVWGVEIRPDIAAWAERNTPGLRVIVSDVAAVDYAGLPRVDHLHASPSCKNASQASDGEEAPEDLSSARAVCRALEEVNPAHFTLENVWQYREFESFKLIVGQLVTLGYKLDWWHLNSADYGGLILCPLHDYVDYAGKNWVRETAPDIVKIAAMMQPEDQARILAWDVVARLGKSTQQAIAEDVAWQGLVNVGNLAQLILDGKVDDTLTLVGTLKYASRAGIDVNIGWLLKECLVDPYLKERWSTTSTETKRITALKILECFLATKNISQNTTNKGGKSTQTGKSEISGGNCPLCKFTGVPQTRKRLILIARKDRQPRRPQPTHSDTLDPWGVYKPWVGWLEAIEDLVDTLPDSEFAPWQLERLPAELKSMLLAQGSYDGEVVNRLIEEPAFTMTANSNQGGLKAFLVNSENQSRDLTVRQEVESTFTVVKGSGHLPKAFLLNRNKSERDDHYKPESDPAYTVCVESGGRQRAYLIDQVNSSSVTTREADEPIMTVSVYNSKHQAPRAFTAGRVVKMTPRALARFMSLPDAYLLPEQNGLACEIIGNMVPALLAKAICESVKE